MMDCFEREEGELLSDEELDDVSDNSSLSSAPILLEGKSSPLLGREPFRELSLTTVSDDSDDVTIVEQKFRLAKQTRDISRDITRDIRRRQCKHRRDDRHKSRRTPERRDIHRRPTSRKRYSSSPDSDHHYVTHRTIYRQLRHAVRINSSQNLPNISLRTRLKRLIPDSPKNHSEEEDLETLRDQALQSTKPQTETENLNNNSVTDEDLIQLRLIALHSAVMKKHQARRIRKEEELKKREEEHNIAAEEQENTELLEDIAQEVIETVPDAEKNDAESIVISALQTAVQNHQERIRKVSISTEVQSEAVQNALLTGEPSAIQMNDVHNLELSAFETVVPESDDIINHQERKKRKSFASEVVQDRSKIIPEIHKDDVTAQPSVDSAKLELFNALKTVVKKHEERRKREESLTGVQNEGIRADIQNIDAITVQPSVELDVQNNDSNLKLLTVFQTAVIRNHQDRRKRKSISAEALPVVSEAPDIEKNKAITVEPVAIEQNLSPKSNAEEDEDILRAMLLTSISKKISNKKLTKTVGNINNNNNNNVPVRQPPSESKPSIKIPKIGPVKRLVINVNSDSDSDCDHHHTVANNDIFDKSLSLFLQQARAKSESEHTSDIAKHLPRSQQLEYKRLKRKLQMLTTKLPLTKTIRNVSSDENKRIKLATNVQGQSSNRQVLNKTSVKVGRLQMKGKYEELSPLMARVTNAHNAREKAQADVKRLINELRIARAKLTTTHQTYTVLIQELVSAKSEIEKRSDDQNVKLLKTTPAICTSTPNKTLLNKDISCELSNIEKIIVGEIPKPIILETCTVKVTEVETMDINDKAETEFLKYTSPLDLIKNSEQSTSNPLLILCPYDLLGVCRDQDCAYRHCGNNTD